MNKTANTTDLCLVRNCYNGLTEEHCVLIKR